MTDLVTSLGEFTTTTAVSFVLVMVGIMLLIYAVFPSTREGGKSGQTLTSLLLISAMTIAFIGFLQLVEDPLLNELIDTESTEGVVLFGIITLGVSAVGAIVLMGFMIPMAIGIGLGFAGRK